MYHIGILPLSTYIIATTTTAAVSEEGAGAFRNLLGMSDVSSPANSGIANADVVTRRHYATADIVQEADQTVLQHVEAEANKTTREIAALKLPPAGACAPRHKWQGTQLRLHRFVH